MRKIAAIILCAGLVAGCTSDADTPTTSPTASTQPTSSSTSPTTTAGQTTTTGAPATTLPSTRSTSAPITDLDPGLFCRDLAPLGYAYADAVAYWLQEGSPDRMDADRNGIPCETVYPAAEVAAYWGTGLPTGGDAFQAELEEVPLITSGDYAGPAWPTSLDDVAFVDEVPSNLRQRLLEDGFVIEPSDGEYDPSWYVEELSYSTQFSAIYEGLSPYDGRAVFVTTDTAYHLWHHVFDVVLRETESERLLPVLERLIASLVAAARDQLDEAAGTPMEDAAQRALEHLQAVGTVLELDVGSIGERARDEVTLVEQHSDIAPSPTVGGAGIASLVDYSLMTPRGHYTRSDDLRRFFKAMSMLGNTPFPVGDPDPLRVGLLVSRLIVSDAGWMADWETIYGPTEFLVGTADDYTPIEAAAVVEDVVPGAFGDIALLASDASVEAVGQGMLDLRPVLIDPSRASLRTMGVRFVLDSWIYDQLTTPGVGGRLEPSPLDLASVMGSTFARDVQVDEGVPAAYPQYEPAVEELSAVVAGRRIGDWGRTVYDGWLYALEPMWADRYEPAYPPFMADGPWDAKAHTTGFGSYTELKHDTILYAKQGIAEGEAPEPPPPPRHWVEPDPVAFGRLAALATMMRDGLSEAGLMLAGEYDTERGDPWNDEERTRWAIDRYIEIVERWEGIARDELDGKPISSDDNAWLTNIGGEIAWLVESLYRGELEPTPLIADVFLNAVADSVLELGTGPPDTIHVLVPNDAGAFQVATGAVYSYYEFWGPRSNRLTDEEWWKTIAEGDLPERPPWWTEQLG